MANKRNRTTNETPESAVTPDTDTPTPAAVPEQAGAPETERKTRVRKNLPPLDFQAITVAVVSDADTMRDFKRTKGTRHPEQVAVDNLVRRAYQAWVDAGRPKTWIESRGLKIAVPASQLDTLKTRIQRSGAYLSLAVRFSDVKEADEHAEVLLVVKDKTTKDDADQVDDDDTDDADDTDDISDDIPGGTSGEIEGHDSESVEESEEGTPPAVYIDTMPNEDDEYASV